MKIKFVCPVEIEVFESFDEALDDGETSTEAFQAGDIVEFDVIDHPQRMIDGQLVDDINTVNVQFGNGSVSFGISKEWYEEL